MSKRYVICCGGVAAPTEEGDEVVVLNLTGPNRNVKCVHSTISKTMAAHLPAFLVDHLELASYVYAADQACSRWTDPEHEQWERRFVFHLPVRDLSFWESSGIRQELKRTLDWLGQDHFEFHFHGFESPPPQQLDFNGTNSTLEIDEVVLFSGGLDSLAGAVHELADPHAPRVALVTHSSNPKRVGLVRDLVSQLRQRWEDRVIHHVRVIVSKSSQLDVEFTQRTRSFLFASLAVAVAWLAGRDRIRFYENGVTSMNLPLSPQVLGARATRTTHPITIENFSRLFSKLLSKPFKVETPFFWKTKTDIVRFLQEHDCADLIARTNSCSRTLPSSGEHPHCGTCSQCIDRRFATLAARLPEHEDPSGGYAVDLMCGERPSAVDRALVSGFVQRARALQSDAGKDIFDDHTELVRALCHLGRDADAALKNLTKLYQRHARDVLQALDTGLERHKDALAQGKLPDTCLLAVVCPDRYRQEGEPNNPHTPVFRLKDDLWTIWFGNNKATFRRSVGLRYIEQLVTQPGTHFSPFDLIALAPTTVPFRAPVETDLTDEKAVQDYKARLKKLKQKIAEATENGHDERRAKLEEEQDKLLKHVKEVTKPNGRPRTERDDRERARDAVRKSITNAIEAIRKKHLPLADHLARHIHSGIDNFYEIPAPVVRIATLTRST